YLAAFSSSGVPVPRPFIVSEARKRTSSTYLWALISLVPRRAGDAAIRAMENTETAAADRVRTFIWALLVIQRGRQLHFTALLGAGFAMRLLVIDFKIDDLAELRPASLPHQFPAIHEQGGRRVDLQQFPLGQVLVYFGLSSLGVHAGSELRLVYFLGLGELQYLLFQILNGDVALMFEDPIVKVPEGSWLLAEYAPASEGGGLRPGVDLLEREILE